MTLTREFAQNQRHEARTTPSPALYQRALMTLRHAPRCLQLHPDRVGARPRCRARETSSRASRADITSSATSIATSNDVPHAKRHLCPSKHDSRGIPSSRSNPTPAQAGNQAHRSTSPCSQPNLRGRLRDESSIALHSLSWEDVFRCRQATTLRTPNATHVSFGVLSFLRGWTSPCFSLSATVSFSALLCPRSWSKPASRGSRGNLTLSQA